MPKKRKQKQSKYEYWNEKIPKNNLLDFSRDLAVEQGKLHRCPFCQQTFDDEAFFVIHLENRHQKAVHLIVRYFGTKITL